MTEEKAKKNSDKTEAKDSSNKASSFPKPNQIMTMATRFCKDIKTSICSIIEDYKKENASETKKESPKKSADAKEKK